VTWWKKREAFGPNPLSGKKPDRIDIFG